MIFYLSALTSLIASMLTNPNWSLMRHDMSVLGARKQTVALNGRKLNRSKSPELFNLALFLLAIEFLSLSKSNNQPIYAFLAMLLVAMGIIDVGIQPLVHVAIAIIVMAIMLYINIRDHLPSTNYRIYALPFITFLSLFLYAIPMIIPKLGGRSWNSFFQKVFFISFATFAVVFAD